MSIFGDLLGFSDAGRAAKSVSDANIAAEHGVLDATGNGQTSINNSLTNTGVNVNNALSAGNTNVNDALQTSTTNVNNAGANVTNAANTANTGLEGKLAGIQGNLAPALQSGVLGNQGLQDYVNSKPKFSFNYDDYKNDPAYQFQLSQGQNAITNQAAASGLQQGGGTLAALTQFGQGLAATHYNDAFNRAQSQFQTNQNTTLANLQALIGSGATANTTNAASTLATGGLESANTTGAANTNAGLQEFLGGLNTAGQSDLAHLNTGSQLGLGQLNLSGQVSGANLGLQGATTAGNFATGAGNAHGAGIIGQGAALNSLIGDSAGLFTSFLGGGGG